MKRDVASAAPDDYYDRSAGVVFLQRYGLVALWFLLAWAMWRSWQQDPYDPALMGTAAYGHNRAHHLPMGLGTTALELAVVYVGIRPWSVSRSWWRPIGGGIAFLVLLPITAFGPVIGLHAGGIQWLHFFWLVLLETALVATVAVALLARFLRWRDRRERAA